MQSEYALQEALRRAVKLCDVAAGEGYEFTHADGEVLDPVTVCELAAEAWGVEIGSPEWLDRLTP